jgi:hypothetical protein
MYSPRAWTSQHSLVKSRFGDLRLLRLEVPSVMDHADWIAAISALKQQWLKQDARICGALPDVS